MMQAVLAELFSLPEQRVRVVAPDVGGSFGIKIHVYQDDMAACAMALMLGRPVKFVASRRESFLSDIHAREQTIRVEVAADGDGALDRDARVDRRLRWGRTPPTLARASSRAARSSGSFRGRIVCGTTTRPCASWRRTRSSPRSTAPWAIRSPPR